jgi:predicted dehydrogenase
MAAKPKYRCAGVSVVKHDYVARGMANHPRFELVSVADEPDVADFVHERNQKFADEFKIPYVRDVERALKEHNVDVAIVSPEAERHVDLSVRAPRLGKHVVQDKPLTTSRDEADRLVAEIEQAGVRFLMWNRNGLPSVQHALAQVAAGAVGTPYAIHVDFYFAKDAGPPKAPRATDADPMDWHAHQKAAHLDGSDGGLGRKPMGELSIEGIYPLAYIRMLTGRDVRRVFATTATAFHQLNVDNDVEDLGAVSLELDGGLVASLAIGRIGAASHPSGGEIKLHILGDRGALVVGESRPEVGVFYRGQAAKDPRMKRVAAENDFFMAEDFAQALDTGGPTMLDARASRAIFATVEAALESARTGRAVAVR